jgi:hypothetical protein
MKPFTTAAGAVPDRTRAFSDTSNGIHRTARAAGRWWIQFSQIHGAKSGWRRLPFTKRSRTGQDRRIRGKLVLAKPDDRQPDYLVSLESGKKMKMLKRYLMTNYSMTPDDYRKKWGLAKDYPMVAPNYAEQRRTLAKSIGLGRRGVVPALVRLLRLPQQPLQSSLRPRWPH